jgi:hypothetical protein
MLNPNVASNKDTTRMKIDDIISFMLNDNLLMGKNKSTDLDVEKVPNRQSLLWIETLRDDHHSATTDMNHLELERNRKRYPPVV